MRGDDKLSSFMCLFCILFESRACGLNSRLSGFSVQKWKQRQKFWPSNCKELVRFRENISRPLARSFVASFVHYPMFIATGDMFLWQVHIDLINMNLTSLHIHHPKETLPLHGWKGSESHSSKRENQSIHDIFNRCVLWRRFVRHACDTWATFS